jgi:paraquat-inducible protein B
MVGGWTSLRLVPAAKSGLNTNARFWLIGANPNFSDLSSLKAVVSGVAIGYAPGEGGEPQDRFEGLDQAPLILPGDKGTRYLLRAHALNSIHEGSIVLFHGQAIGKIIAIHFNGDQKEFRLQAFINQPYDSLIRRGARFWKISPLRLSFAGGGITANLAPLSASSRAASTWRSTPPILAIRKARQRRSFSCTPRIMPRAKDYRDPRYATNLRLTAMRAYWTRLPR